MKRFPQDRSVFRAALFVLLLVLSFAGFTDDAKAQTEGEYLYKVTLLRAAPGHFNELMDALEASFSKTTEAGDIAPFWMRHSQGDHWDFMVIYPMEDWDIYNGADRTARRASAWSGASGTQLSKTLESHLSYSEDWFTRSIGFEEMTRRFKDMGLFHIEMFAGLPGKRDELLEQRRMENRYYAHLNRQQNVIFTRSGGSNWDSMTIGFHESLTSFVANSNLYSAEEQEEAALVAGFSGTNDIGPYLRSLLSYHNDTLAVRPR